MSDLQPRPDLLDSTTKEVPNDQRAQYSLQGQVAGIFVCRERGLSLTERLARHAGRAGAMTEHTPLDTHRVLTRPERLDVLRRTVLLDSPAEEAFDRLTRLASKILDAPVSLVSLVDEDRQFFKSCVGLPAPWSTARETPLSHSFCQHAVASGEPLVIDDALKSDLVRDNLAVRDLSVVAYAGIPLIISNETVGSFCVIDSKPRHWSEGEISILKDLAASVATEIELRLMTAEARSEAEAAETARLEVMALLESTGEGMFGIDESGRCTFINREALEQLRYDSMDEVLGRPMHELIHHTRRDGTPYPVVDCPMHSARINRAGVRVDDEILWRKDGTSFPVSYAAYPLIIADELVGVVTSFGDVSERRRAEAERQRLLEAEQTSREKAEMALRMRDEMLAIVSHDLRNPASTIFSSAALMLETALDEDKRRQQIQIVKRQAERMSSLIGDLLDVTLIETGRLRVTPSANDVASLLDEACRSLHAEAKASHLELTIVPDSDDGTVDVDGDRIQQVFGNLIGNAIRHTAAGGSIEIGAEADGAVMVFTVRDSGVGIPANDLDHLFDRYWQGRSQRRGGAGLGLPISKGIVEAHGGRMWVESRVGSGTAFHFSIPKPTAEKE